LWLVCKEIIMKKKSKMIIDDYGNKYWYLNNKWHREDGPAIEYANGDKVWYLNGEQVKEEDIIEFNPNLTEREYIEFVINLWRKKIWEKAWQRRLEMITLHL